MEFEVVSPPNEEVRQAAEEIAQVLGQQSR